MEIRVEDDKVSIKDLKEWVKQNFTIQIEPIQDDFIAHLVIDGEIFSSAYSWK